MNNEFKKGIFFAFGAYILWGILPIYWDLIEDIGAFEILAFRIILSMIFNVTRCVILCVILRVMLYVTL